MQISYAQFKTAVEHAHYLHTKMYSLELSIFEDTRAIVVAYVNTTPNWRMHVTKKQANDTIPYCIELQEGNCQL